MGRAQTLWRISGEWGVGLGGETGGRPGIDKEGGLLQKGEGADPLEDIG